MLIGLCGKSGSGKSTVARSLVNSKPNIVHCDIDKIGHEVIKKDNVQKELVAYFGTSILTDEVIDRSKLSKLVFSSKVKMKRLESITWKHMQVMINDFIITHENKIIILDWALLYKTEYFNKCDIKVLIDVPYEIRKERAIKRDMISEEKFDLREQASIAYDNSKFDVVITDNVDELRKKLSL